ncbi:Sensor histidine kinase RcsC [Usitatibacter rugosus]|uniref:histidine kinase n=1 Tax=Usitatibacter rugosus TaxID=2732067 RepID=A0A6M4GS01_9PROT|nr:ATP-binding protein [Usitatibacter rugosus]QJR10089.1 Sensor histidine kinase RcsC [Usitatibacter rugosus]
MATAAFLEGGGELGALMRAYDWSATPLGEPEGWPRSLKTAVRIMLTSRQPFWLGWGPDLTYLYNDAYKSIIGGKHPRALGRPFSEVWSEIWDVVGPMAQGVMTRDEGTYVEEQLLIMERHGYQEETYYTFSYSPVPDDEGRVTGLICANSEDTGRVIGERQLALLRELASRTATARTWQDACHRSMDAFGTNRRDLPFALLYARRDNDQAFELAAACDGSGSLHDPAQWPLARVLHTGEPAVVSLERMTGLPKGDWPRPPEQAAVLPVVSPGGSGHSGALVVGLSPFRRFDGAYRDFLGLVAGQVAAAIANAEAYEHERLRAEALAELDRAKTAFFSNVSHEFRTPLTLMLGPIEELALKAETDGPAEDHAQLAAVQRNGHRLLKLVNTLLDFARIEAGRAQTSFEATDLAAFTADLAANFRAACERAGIALRVEAPPASEPAWIDREMWEKVVLNLLSNAFKFTLQGEIAVTVRERPEGFQLSVRDTGVGIPAESLPHMFQRFHRVEGTRGRSHEGSGIGLALVQELVKVHGGRIELRSTLGEGTEFVVTLPKGFEHLPADRVQAKAVLASSAPRAGAYVEEALSWLPDSAPAANSESRNVARVLVADDNRDLRDYLRRLLGKDYEVITVGDGEEALAAMRSQMPDLVVSDVMMPKLDGIALVKAIRGDPALRTLPIILLSARAGEEARIHGMASGADDYLVKPFSARELQVRVAALLESAEVRRESQAELQRNAAQLSALVDAAPLGIYMVDGSFRLAAVNPIALPVFGDIPNLIGMDFEEVLHRLWPKADAEEMTRNFRRTLATGEPFTVPEYAEKRVDSGIVEYWQYRVHRIPLPGEEYGVVCYFRDISADVRAREALREADRRKDEFIATLSHELRNPLAPLRNSLHLLGMARDSNPAAQRVHEVMERQVNHLVRLVDDLLEMSRISRGTLELRREPVDLASIVRNAVETADPLMQAGGHRLDLKLPEAPVMLDADPVRLGQVLGNVLNNAAKYTEPGGKIDVEARVDDGVVQVSVRDNGAGIAPEERERIFDMFTRGTGRQSVGGLGIGLALARQLMKLHGGTIEASSEGLGRGSEFRVRLPVLDHALAAESSAPNLAQGLEGKRVLVVDDNRDAGDSLAMILRMLGCDVRVAGEGPEALEVLKSFAAEVVLLDIGMPGMDGYQVAREIHRNAGGSRPVIIALTGWGQEQDRLKAREAGFDHHLVKPAEIGPLQELLASL